MNKPHNRLSGRFDWKRTGGIALFILALVAGLLLAQGNSASGLLPYLPFLLILACPVMMLFMMGAMGSMDHHSSGSHTRYDSINGETPNMSGMTRDEQVWTLRNELARMAWRQESLRQDLERLEREPGRRRRDCNYSMIS